MYACICACDLQSVSMCPPAQGKSKGQSEGDSSSSDSTLNSSIKVTHNEHTHCVNLSVPETSKLSPVFL